MDSGRRRGERQREYERDRERERDGGREGGEYQKTKGRKIKKEDICSTCKDTDLLF